jgi:hypothetical protein
VCAVEAMRQQVSGRIFLAASPVVVSILPGNEQLHGSAFTSDSSTLESKLTPNASSTEFSAEPQPNTRNRAQSMTAPGRNQGRYQAPFEGTAPRLNDDGMSEFVVATVPSFTRLCVS